MCDAQHDISCLSESDINSALKDDTLSSRLCNKCNKEQAKVVLRVKDVYCESCFLTTATHKFRATLGKSHLIRPGDKVLVAYNGDPNSSALLHLVKSGLSQNTHKKLRFDPVILYIEERVYSNTNPDQTSFTDIVDKIKSTNLPFYITSLSQALASEISLKSDLDSFMIDEELDKELLITLSKFKTATAKQDFLKKLKYNLIASAALSLHCQYVFVADICTKIASTLLSNIALGRGAHLPLDVAFMDARFSNLKILRPMRDFITDEVLYYNSFNNIQPISHITQKSDTSSIQNLTKSFVNELQENFPATIYTVFRTGEKLSTNNKSCEISESCAFCNAPLDTKCSESSALQATKFSKMVSCVGPQSDTSGVNLNYVASCNNTNLKQNTEQDINIERYLCYGCTIMSRDLDKEADLPGLFRKMLVKSETP